MPSRASCFGRTDRSRSTPRRPAPGSRPSGRAYLLCEPQAFRRTRGKRANLDPLRIHGMESFDRGHELLCGRIAAAVEPERADMDRLRPRFQRREVGEWLPGGDVAVGKDLHVQGFRRHGIQAECRKRKDEGETSCSKRSSDSAKQRGTRSCQSPGISRREQGICSNTDADCSPARRVSQTTLSHRCHELR